MIHDNRTRTLTKGSVSGRYLASGSPFIVPRVTLSSFGRSKFTWCLQEAWGEDDYGRFLALSQNAAWNPFRRLECVNQKMRNVAQPVGKWLLKEDVSRVVAAAEVLAVETAFSRVTVNISVADEALAYEKISESVSYFVSAMFLITGADLIVLALPDGDVQKLVDVIWGEGKPEKAGAMRHVRAVRSETFLGPEDWSIPLKPMEFLEVSSAEWWTSDSAKRDFQDLKYLQKRIEIDQKRAEMASGLRRKKAKSGFLSRIFKRS